MNYNEIRAAIDKCRKTIMALRKSLKDNEDEHNSLKNTIHNVESNYQMNLRNEKDAALLQAIEQSTRNYKHQISALENQIANKKQEYQQRLDALDSSDLRNSYSDEEAMTAEVRASLAVLQEQLSKSISVRFQNELESQLECQELSIQDSDVDKIVRFFNKQSRTLSKMSHNSSIDNFIDSILKYVRIPVNGDMSDNKGKITYGIISVLLVMIFILASRIVFPVYVALLGLLLCYNLSKNYKIYNTLVAQKAVKDNLAVIENSLKEKAIQQREMQRAELQHSCDEELLVLQKQLDDLNQKLLESERTARDSFVFDDTDAQNRYQNAMKINNGRVMANEEEHTKIKTSLQEQQAELSRLENEMLAIAGGVQEEYLDLVKVGSENIFLGKFIVDIKNSKPVFFMHPKKSILMLYENIDDCVDFIKLISLQLRIKMHPHIFNCTIADTENLGVPFLPFNTDVENADEAVKKLYRIITTNDTVKETFEEFSDILEKRVLTIRTEYDDIIAYNQAMLETDSLPENYNFIFCLNPSMQLLNDEKFRKVYANGGSTGIYTHLFIKSSEFYEMKQLGKLIIENSGSIFILKDGTIQRRAQEFALENLIKQEN